MYEHRMTKPQALAATRWLVVDFHENMPAVDFTSEAVLLDQFVRDLSAQVQFNADVDAVIELLETLDRGLDLHFRVGEYTGLDDETVAAEKEYLSNVFRDDLNRLLAHYSPRAAHYFETRRAA